MLENKLFDKLRKEQPSCFDKLIPIAGDVIMEHLGLLPGDRQTLIEKISIIYHIAATVRFDESLRRAILNNTRSTRDICILAQHMKKLVTLVHVSSAYTQIDKAIVEEKIYPFDVSWKQMIKIAENVDDYTLNILTAKCLESIPNTYIFSKKLAEEVINDYSKSLPCVLIRPSIVIASVEDPIEGWIDNFNGPSGMFLGAGKGILRVMHFDPQAIPDYLPVDVFAKATVIVTWKCGTTSVTEDDTIHVYNFSTHNMQSVSVQEIINHGVQIINDVPLDNVIWTPSVTLRKNYKIYYVMMILLHVLPAMLIDGILKLLGKPPILLNVHKRIYVTNSALSYFSTNAWQFHNDNLLHLFDNLSEINKKDFGFTYQTLDLKNFFKNMIIGSKMHLLKEDMNNLEASKRHFKRMYWLDKIVKTLFVFMILWILYRRGTLYFL